MASLKTLGGDGFHVVFFPNQWDSIESTICDWVKEIFKGKPIDLELNNTLIILILKTSQPKEISQFRPISLCSVLYKLVTKVISNRFKVVIPKPIALE